MGHSQTHLAASHPACLVNEVEFINFVSNRLYVSVLHCSGGNPHNRIEISLMTNRKQMSKDSNSAPIILLVEEDNNTRPILRHNLINDGFHVRLALDEDDALDRVSGGHAHADLILINLVKKTPEEVLSAGRRIREHAKYDGQTPLVVLAEKYSKEQEGTDVNIAENDWITYLEEHDQLTKLLRRLVQHLTA